MLKRIDNYLEKGNTKVLLSAALGTTLLLGFVDYFIGPELSFSVFYTGPIVLTAWYAGKRYGLIIAIVSSLVWMTADIMVSEPYSNTFIPIWNTLVRLSFFMIILGLLLTVKNKLILEASLADTDPLTDISNRRFFMEQLEREISRLTRYPEPFTIAYIDLDNFKYINDSLGHDVGDELLVVVANSLVANIRASDMTARLGGDEFALLFPVLEYELVLPVLKTIQDKLLAEMAEKNWPVTFSIGAITFNEIYENTRDTVKAVDNIMYDVKKSGKNNIRHILWSSSN